MLEIVSEKLLLLKSKNVILLILKLENELLVILEAKNGIFINFQFDIMTKA